MPMSKEMGGGAIRGVGGISGGGKANVNPVYREMDTTRVTSPTTFQKPSGIKGSVPGRNVNTKQTRAGEEAMGRAQDTGRGRGPLRGIARRAREKADLENVSKYPSQKVTNYSVARGRVTSVKIGKNGKVVPTKTTPVKRSSK